MSGFSPRYLLEVLRRLPSCQRYWLAYSGGRDSHVLLHALAVLRPELSAHIQVIHIDHGLQPDSARWVLHCQSICATLQIPFLSRRVQARPLAGQSPEAAARQARYAELGGLLAEGDMLLTAHHRDDQAETLMLQLLRGAGPHGLAAMPESRVLGAGLLVRPLLGFSRHDLEDYARQQDLHWIDDPSNGDTGFRRNYLRHEVMPQLHAQWPAADRTLARSAGLCADAAILLDQLAEKDMLTLVMGDGLSIAGLQGLDPVRQRNVLRYWCASKALPLPGQAHIQQIQQQMASTNDGAPLICWPGAELRCYRGCMMIMSPLPPLDTSLEWAWDMSAVLDLPHGRLSAHSGQGGLDAELWRQQITVRFRRGGERFRLASGKHHSLKKFLQEQHVAPWQRDRIPLIFSNGELAVIAGLLVCEDFVARPNRPSFRFEWNPC